MKQADNSPVLEGLERSLKQMQAMREGKLPKPSISELFTQNAEAPNDRVDE